MQIQGTITRAYVGEGFSGTNSRFNGRNVIHVRPTDPSVLRDIDGGHQTADGDLRIAVPAGELPEVGTELDVELDETKPTLEIKAAGPRRRPGRRGEGPEGGEGSEGGTST